MLQMSRWQLELFVRFAAVITDFGFASNHKTRLLSAVL